MKEKYRGKMKKFIERCELPTEIHELAEEKKKKEKKGRWPQFKENYYNELGAQYDRILLEVKKEKTESFASYMK